MRQLARATDDGYRSRLVPGLKASADAERLADELAFAATRLARARRPTRRALYAEALLEADREEGLWLAFLTAVLCPGDGDDPFADVRAAHVPWAEGELPRLSRACRGRAARDPGDERTARRLPRLGGARRLASRRRSPARRRGRRSGASTASSSASRCPGFDRGARYDFLVAARAARARRRPGRGQLHFGDDATTLAAKRVFGIGDAILLERRAGDLAEEAEVPLEALDLALFNWGQPTGGRVTMGAGEASPELRATAAAALDV